MKKSYLEYVANTIWSQIVGIIGFEIPMSWGISKMYTEERVCRDGYKFPCLMMHVSGLLHTGWVCIALNDGLDTYEIALLDENANYKEWYTDLYFDEIGKKIDALVERKPEWSDEEYQRLALADSDKKMKEMTVNNG